MTMTLQAEMRHSQTKSAVKELRKNGYIPAVIYGKEVPSTAIMVEEKQLLALLRENPHGVVELHVPEHGKQPVMVSDMQRDKLYRNLLHVDFHQINMNEPVRATVAVELVGEAIGTKEGGVLQAVQTEVEIRCLPQNIPESLPVDISQLEVGASLQAGDLILPAGLELKTDEHAVLVTILATKVSVDEETPSAEQNAETDAEQAAEEQPVS